MDASRPAPADKQWEEHEKVRLFTEILIQAQMRERAQPVESMRNLPSPSQILFDAILGLSVLPVFEDLVLPRDRSMNACHRLYNEYVHRSSLAPVATQAMFAGLPPYDLSGARKRPYPQDTVSSSTMRHIAPRPASYHPDSGSRPMSLVPQGPLTPSEGAPPLLADPTRRKRGRPTKLEQQKKHEAQLRHSQMGLPPRGGGGGGEGGGGGPLTPTATTMHRFSISGQSGPIGVVPVASPVAQVAPISTPKRGGSAGASTNSGGSESRKKRGRPPKNPPSDDGRNTRQPALPPQLKSPSITSTTTSPTRHLPSAAKISPTRQLPAAPSSQPPYVGSPRLGRERRGSISTRSDALSRTSAPYSSASAVGPPGPSFPTTRASAEVEEGSKRTTRRIWEHSGV